MTGALTGTTLDERYHFEHMIGSGTFAEVYLITDLRRRAKLAAKVLRSDIARDSALLERFQREAAVLSRLQHPHIVRYYDIVEAEGYRFILMDYVPGHTLDDELYASTDPVRPQHSLSYLTPLASALHFAHSEGVIHRDLKPANILLHESGTLFVTDFGIARLLNVTSELTLDKTIGTPLYMAPEQITGDPVTVATDIYALGVILFRMYTGRPPFRGDSGVTGASTTSRITYEHVHNTPPAPTELNPHLDLAVQEIIMRCLQKEPSRRFQSISDLFDALAEAIGAPPLAIDAPADYGDQDIASGTDRPDIKLPEWSQFMPPVGQSDEEHDTLVNRMEFDESETLAPQVSPDRLDPPNKNESPYQTAPSQPSDEDPLHSAAQTLTHQPLVEAAQTLTNSERAHPGAHPTLRSFSTPRQPEPSKIAPPRYAYDDRDHLPPRRSSVTSLLIIGGLLIVIVLCVVIIYLGGGFVGKATPRDPEADITLSVRPGAGANTSTSDVVNFAQPASGTLIAFDSRRAGNLDIYIANADGTDVRQVTGSSGAERGPAWSPDGTRIAFYGAASENSSYDIYVINVDGTNLQNLTRSPNVDDRYPTWSPDGTQIAFHSNASGDFEIYIVNVDGTGMYAVTDNNADDLGPDWSPDGTQITYHTSLWGFPYELAILDISSGQVRRLTNNDDTNTFPTWSPDGTQIAYNAISSRDNSTNIFLINTDGSNIRQITDTQDRNAFPYWSPDGTRLIYQRGQPDVSAIYTIPLNGGDPVALTDGQGDFLPDWQP